MMDIDKLLSAFVFVFGLVVGSFMNVVIARLPLDQSVVRPRSRCPKCAAEIRWYDNLPVLSYALLRGRCRGCQVRISLRYPVVELLVATLALAAKLKFGWSWVLFARDIPFVAAMVAITFIDLDHRIIPDELSIGGMVLGLATTWAVPQVGLAESVAGAALGFGVFYFFAWLYLKLRGQSGLGGGDIKLLGMIGAFLGPSGVFCAILISSVLGSVVGIGWALVSQRGKARTGGLMTVAIPYGPFLVLGALYYYLLGDLLWFRFTIPI